MKICENGIIRDMTSQETAEHNVLAAQENTPTNIITVEERVGVLEGAVVDLAEVVYSG